jgi:hypothetical protein
MRPPTRERGLSLDRLSVHERVEIRKLWRRGMSVWKISQLLKLEPWKIYYLVANLEEKNP